MTRFMCECSVLKNNFLQHILTVSQGGNHLRLHNTIHIVGILKSQYNKVILLRTALYIASFTPFSFANYKLCCGDPPHQTVST